MDASFDQSLLNVEEIRLPPPDPDAEPEGFIVVMENQERIHFLDWGGPAEHAVLLIHGLSQTGWIWAPVARRLRPLCHVVALDLLGHGLSDAPTSGYEPEQLAEDAVAVAEGAGQLAGVVVVGHGFGAMIAAWTAARLGDRCGGLVLVDGGWEDIRASSGMEPDEWLRTMEEPPEVVRSMTAFLADRAGFDPETWDADQERAARATVVEVPAGRVVPATRPHALNRAVEAMFAYRPDQVLAGIMAPIVAVEGADDEEGSRHAALAHVQSVRGAAGLPPIRVVALGPIGHNLMRYRPDAVAAAILSIAQS